MKVASVHFNPKISPHLQHNDRTNSNSKNIIKDLSHLNECDKKASEVLREIDKLHKEAMDKLKGKKGKRTPKERSFHEAIFEISETTTMEQCRDLANAIAELTGFTPLQIAIHRDEGYTNSNGEFVTHYHAHAVFFTLDRTTGKQLARQEASLTKWNLSKMQDMASEILGMQRGEERLKKGKKKYYIQDYKEYKAVQETLQERGEFALRLFDKAQEGLNEINEREDKLKRAEVKVKERWENIKEFEKEIQKAKEAKLNAQEAKILGEKEKNKEILFDIKTQRERLKDEKAIIDKKNDEITKKEANNKRILQEIKELRSEREEKRKDSFQRLEKHYQAKSNIWLNLLTLGWWERKNKREYENARTQLHQSLEIAEKEYQVKIESLKNQIRSLQIEKSEAQQTIIEKDEQLRYEKEQKEAWREEAIRLVKTYEPHRIQQEKTETQARTPKQHTQSQSRGR